MIIKLNNDGTLSAFKDRVFKMSNGVNTVTLFSSVSKYSTILINFKLPNGTIINGNMIYSGFSLDENNNFWQYDIKQPITTVAGRIEIGLEVKEVNTSKLLLSAKTYMTVEESLPSDLETPTDINLFLDTANEALANSQDALDGIARIDQENVTRDEEITNLQTQQATNTQTLQNHQTQLDTLPNVNAILTKDKATMSNTYLVDNPKALVTKEFMQSQIQASTGVDLSGVIDRDEFNAYINETDIVTKTYSNEINEITEAIRIAPNEVISVDGNSQVIVKQSEIDIANRKVNDTYKNSLIYENSQAKIVENVDQKTCNGSEGWVNYDTASVNTIAFMLTAYTNSGTANADTNTAISNLFIQKPVHVNTVDVEGFMQNGTYLYVRILRSKLTTPDVAGFKSYLNVNNLIVTYKTATQTTRFALTDGIKSVVNPVIKSVKNNLHVVKEETVTYKINGANLTATAKRNKIIINGTVGSSGIVLRLTNKLEFGLNSSAEWTRLSLNQPLIYEGDISLNMSLSTNLGTNAFIMGVDGKSIKISTSNPLTANGKIGAILYQLPVNSTINLTLDNIMLNKGVTSLPYEPTILSEIILSGTYRKIPNTTIVDKAINNNGVYEDSRDVVEVKLWEFSGTINNTTLTNVYQFDFVNFNNIYLTKINNTNASNGFINTFNYENNSNDSRHWRPGSDGLNTMLFVEKSLIDSHAGATIQDKLKSYLQSIGATFLVQRATTQIQATSVINGDTDLTFAKGYTIYNQSEGTIPALNVKCTLNVAGQFDIINEELIEIENNINDIKEIYVNVKGFGTKGDGVSDDTQALTNAINYAITNKPATIFIPKGTYLYTSLPNIAYSGITIKGVSSRETTLKCTNSSDNHTAILIDAFAVMNAFQNKCNVKNLTVEGNSKTSIGFKLRGIARSVWEDVVFKNGETTNGKAFELNGVMLSSFKSVICSKNLDVGYTMPKYGLYATRGFDNSGASIGSSTNNSFINCYFEYTAIGIYLDYFENNIFLSGSPEANTEYSLLTTSHTGFNTFLGVGFESDAAFADIVDEGYSNQFINVYSTHTVTLKGRQAKISGGVFAKVEIQATAQKTIIENILVNLRGTNSGGFIDSGTDTKWSGVFDFNSSVNNFIQEPLYLTQVILDNSILINATYVESASYNRITKQGRLVTIELNFKPKSGLLKTLPIATITANYRPSVDVYGGSLVQIGGTNKISVKINSLGEIYHNESTELNITYFYMLTYTYSI